MPLSSQWNSIAHSKKAKSVTFGLLNGIAVIALYFIVDYTSPLYPPTYSLQDSSIFRLVGKIWAEGGLPYVDIWDHKGPLIFFTNMLGAQLGDPIHGVFFVDLAIMLITAWLLWRVTVVSMPDSSTPIRLLAFWFSLAVLTAMLFGVWDLSETVCFPFLAASLWLALRDAGARTFLPSKDGDDGFHVSPLNAYVQGMAVSACLLTRLTSAVAVVGTVLVLAIMLITRRHWMNLMICAVWFFAGFATLVAPFAAYFALHGAFGDFIYGTVIFNLSYAAKSNFFSYGLKAVLSLMGFPAILTAMAIVAMVHRKTVDAAHVIITVAGMLTLILFSRLEPFPHYYTILIFFLPSVLATVEAIVVSKAGVRTAALTLVAMMIIIPPATNFMVHLYVPNQRTEFSSPTIKRIIQESHGSVAFYNIDAMAYLVYDIQPSYRYAVLQDWQASFSDQFRSNLVTMYENPRTEYLIVNPWGVPLSITDILNTKYQLVEETHESSIKTIRVYRAISWQ